MKKIFLLSLTFLLAFFSSNSFAMSSRFSQQAKNFAQQSFEKAKNNPRRVVFTGLSWVIAGADIMYDGYTMLQPDEKKILPISNPYVKDFVKKQLSAVGCDTSRITVKVCNAEQMPLLNRFYHPHQDGKELLFRHNTLYMTAEQQRALANLLENERNLEKNVTQQEKTDQELNQWRFVLQNNGAHIHNNTLRNRGLVLMTAPVATHIAGTLLRKCITSRTPSNTGKIVGALCKREINAHIFSTVAKNQIQQADDSVVNQKEILESGVAFHKTRQQAQDKFVHALVPENPNIKPDTLKMLRAYWYWFLNFQQPAPQERIQKLEQRIAKIEKPDYLQDIKAKQ